MTVVVATGFSLQNQRDMKSCALNFKQVYCTHSSDGMFILLSITKFPLYRVQHMFIQI
jgi:hypothetical protein